MRYADPLAPRATLLREGSADLSGYIDERIDHYKAIDPTIRAFVDEPNRGRRVRSAASALVERDRPAAERPALHGIPIGVKDVFHVDGLPTKAGSTLPAAVLGGPEAPVVTALTNAGAIVFGKTVTTEFAHFEPGPTRNPEALERTPGGSSSGSAAAVAAGMVPLALGSQTIGSVIRPAAFCGVVGFKPTFGRVPTDGMVTLSTSADQVGWFTQDVDGAALVAACCVADWQALTTPQQQPTLGVPVGSYLDQAAATGREAFSDHVDRLVAAGYTVVRADPFTAIERVNNRHRRVVAAEAARAHDEWIRSYGDRYAASTQALIERGQRVSVRALAGARRSQIALRDRLSGRMETTGIDLWITPAAPGPTPRGIGTTGDPVMNLPWTHAGLPAITVPAGSVNGVPLGLQLVGRFGADESVVAWARGIERALSNR